MKEASTSEAFDKHKPEACVFVISVDKDGKPSGMACARAMKCSRKPGIYAVALWKDGHTQKLIRESKEFVVAVANKSLKKELTYFGSVSGKNVDKFKESGIETEKAEFIKSPLIKNATINFECKLINEVEVGEHILFIGEILVSYINEDKDILFNLGSEGGVRKYMDIPKQ